MLDQTGKTRLDVPALPGRDADTVDRALLEAVQEAAAGEYEVLGEMGRIGTATVVYLAREIGGDSLVALRVEASRGQDGVDEYLLDIVRQLDGTIPSSHASCPQCHATLMRWGRYCSQCGSDVSGAAESSTPGGTRELLLEAVKEAAAGEYDILGEMPHAEGGGIVYFARDRAGRVTALRLTKERAAGPEGREEFSLGATQILKPLLGECKPPPPGAFPTPASGVPGPQSRSIESAEPKSVVAIGTARDSRIEIKPVHFAALAGIVVIVVGAVMLSRANPTPPKPASPQVETTLDTTAIQPAVAPPVIDSAEVRFARNLPSGATLTIDGDTVSTPSVKLVPGTYTLGVSARGYRSLSEEAELSPGDVWVWPSEAMERVRPPPRPTRPPAQQPEPTPTVPAQPLSCAEAYDEKRFESALETCPREAAAGGTTSQKILGHMYQYGLATTANYREAAKWYQMAANAGDAKAQYSLGWLYLIGGHGLERSVGLARQWFQKAADQGDEEAKKRLEEM